MLFWRPQSCAGRLRQLWLIFQKDGTVTAGNASGINAAAAVILASEAGVATHGLKPLIRMVSYEHAGVDPDYLGIGPVHTSLPVVQRAGLTVADMDVSECNEAFAVQECAVSKKLGFGPAWMNPNGSGISLGHPIGATGAIIVTKLVHELACTDGRYGLATMCSGGRRAIATIWGRVNQRSKRCGRT